MIRSVRTRQRAPRPSAGTLTPDAVASPRPVDSRLAGTVNPRQRPSEGAPVAGAPGWYVIRRTAPPAADEPMRSSRRFRLIAVAVTAALVPLLLVLSMVRAQWSEGPAGPTVVVPMPSPVMAPGRGSAPTAAPVQQAPTDEPANPPETFATAAGQTKPDPVLPEERALLPLESIGALQWSTAEWASRPDAAAPSRMRFASANDGLASRALELREQPGQASRSLAQVRNGTATPGSAAEIEVASQASTPDQPGQPGRSSPQAASDPATPVPAAEIQVASQATTPDDHPALPAGEIRIFIHHVAGQRDGALAQRLADYLRGDGFTVTDIRAVRFSIGKPSVRYFFARDRAASQRLVEELARFPEGGTSLAPDQASDFTHFLPKPSPGNVEVWLPTS
jgi:hypothetical protein